MSGIVGIINLNGQPVERLLLRRLTEFLASGGPDAQEVWTEGPVGLGHAMLRTTFESEHERQPYSLDGRVWITADARIDGRAELLRELAGKGCGPLKDITDPEIILQAYRVWGEDCVRHLLGDFAFAIWDGPRRRLFCARDHSGIKPFFYARVKDCFVFSNALDCLRQHPQVSDELNELAIADFLLFDFNQEPATTSFADIQRLPAAHSAVLRDGVFRTQRYWTLPLSGPIRYKRQSDYVEHFIELLQQAVADRLRTRRVGVLMSGGLDSSTVASQAAAIRAAESFSGDLRAYTWVFDRLIPDEERHYAGLAASHLNLPIEFLVLDDYEPFRDMDRGDICGPEPFQDPLGAMRVDIVKKAQKHGRVILTGEGGDAILYPGRSYLYYLLRQLEWARLTLELGRCVIRYHRLPQIGFRSGLNRWLGQAPRDHYPDWLNNSFAARLKLPERWRQLRQAPPSDHPTRPEADKILANPAWQYQFEGTHPGATRLPVESRHPFFDTRLMAYALALPPVPWCVDKIMLREAGRGFLPEAVHRRPKTPLVGDPLLLWLQKNQGDFLGRLGSAKELEGWVDIAKISSLTDKDNCHTNWENLRPVSLYYWLKQLKAGHSLKTLDSNLATATTRGR